MRANLMQLRNLWDTLAPSCEILKALVSDGLKEDGRGGAMLGWVAPPGSPFQVVYPRPHPSALRAVVEFAFDKAENRYLNQTVPAENHLAVWQWGETTHFPAPQRWCGRGFGPNPTPAGANVSSTSS